MLINIIALGAIYSLALVCLQPVILSYGEPTNGRVWDLIKRYEISDSDVETIELDPSIVRLPQIFDINNLPKPIQTSDSNGEKIIFDHIGVVDMLTNHQPTNPFEIATKFHLYSGTRQKVVQFKLQNNCISPKTSPQRECGKIPFDLNELHHSFDPSKRTIIMIGGFLSQAPIDWQLKMADKWMRIEDVNVIIVSWNKGNKYLYSKAVSNTKVVARQIVMLLYYLAQVHNIDPKSPEFLDKINIVGHSLGAHIAGFVGQDFGGKIGRITGLDPAGPLFSENHESHRLDRNDAQFVDAFHTNADFGIQVFLGIYTQVGHVDFYANDGKWQPSCPMSIHFLQCNHGSVIYYYISILDHELAMRRQYDLRKRDKYRIVAYKAKSFNQFRNGRSLQLNCPKMALDISDDTHMQSGVADFKMCGIPIDFIKRPKELRHELETKYNINFEPNFKPTEKYWFFTSHKMPFVVEHNLMKIHYDVPQASDGYDAHDKQCSLHMRYTMLDGEKSTREVPKFKPTFEGIDHPHTTIPFVNHNLAGRYALINADTSDYFNPFEPPNEGAAAMSQEEKLAKSDRLITENAYGIFPAKIDLFIDRAEYSHASSKGIFKRWFNDDDFSGPLGNSFMQDWEAKECAYKIKSVRLQPLRATGRLYMGIYSTRAKVPESQNLMKKGIFKPKIVRLKEGESIPDIEMPGAIVNPTLYLDTILIGQANDNYNSDDVATNLDSERQAYDVMRTPYEEAILMGKYRPLRSQDYLLKTLEGPNPDKDLENLHDQLGDDKLRDTPFSTEKSFYDFSLMGSFE